MSQNQQEKPNTFQYYIKNDPREIEKQFSIENGELLSDVERMASLDILAEYQKKMVTLEQFMRKEYMDFSSKINRCMLNNCYKDIHQPRNEIRECVQGCSQGIKNADKFVKEKIDMFTSSFGQCIEEAQKPKKNVMQEVFECYDTMLNTFESLRRDIKEEFSYYE